MRREQAACSRIFPAVVRRLPFSEHAAVVFRPRYWRALSRRRRRRKRGKLEMRTGVLNTTDSPGIASGSEPRLSPASVAQPISRTQELEHLAQADWHIAEVSAHIKRQRLRVEKDRKSTRLNSSHITSS